MAFVDALRRAGLSVKVRKRKGSEIDAACGQLRRRVEQESTTHQPEAQAKDELIPSLMLRAPTETP